MRDFVVTKNQQGRAAGRRYVVFPVGTQPAIMSSADFRAPPKKTVPVEPLRPLKHLYTMDNSIQETQNLPSWTNVHKIFVFGTSIHCTFALVPRVSPE